MKTLASTLALAGSVLLAASFQEAQRAAEPSPAEAAGIVMAQPASEHAFLAERLGTWEADFQMWMGPEPTKAKGTMTYEALGPFWIVGRFRMTLFDLPFEGLELTGFDPEAKQFVSTWVDSLNPLASHSRGVWDEATRTLALEGKEKHPVSGEEEPVMTRTVFEGRDRIVMTMRYASAPDPVMRVVYTRKP